MKKSIIFGVVLVFAIITLSACNTNDSNLINNANLGRESLFISSYGSGGTLTITDIPSEFNAQYAVFNASLDEVIYIRGYQSIDELTETTFFSQIIDGSVSIPLYLWKNDIAGNSFDSESSYTGNETVTSTQSWLKPCLLIWGGEKSSPLIDPFPVGRIEFDSITFSNGSATVSANMGTFKDETITSYVTIGEGNQFFNAEILTIKRNPNYAIVKPFEDEAIFDIADHVYFDTSNLGDSGFQDGDYIRVQYTGNVYKSYPAKIDAVRWYVYCDKTPDQD